MGQRKLNNLDWQYIERRGREKNGKNEKAVVRMGCRRREYRSVVFFLLDVLSTVLNGAGIVDSEVLQTVRNEY